MSITREPAVQQVTTRTAIEVNEPWVTWALLQGWLQAGGNWQWVPGGLQRDISDGVLRLMDPKDAITIRSSYRDWMYLLGLLGAMGLPRDIDPSQDGEAEVTLSLFAVGIEGLLFTGDDE